MFTTEDSSDGCIISCLKHSTFDCVKICLYKFNSVHFSLLPSGLSVKFPVRLYRISDTYGCFGFSRDDVKCFSGSKLILLHGICEEIRGFCLKPMGPFG